MSDVKMPASGEQREETITGGVEVEAEAIFPVERDLKRFRAGDIVKVEDGNRAGEEFRMIGEGNAGVEAGIVGSPLEGVRVEAACGEDLCFGAIGQIVKNRDGMDFLVERVVKTSSVSGDNEFAVLGNSPVVDPVRIVGEPGGLFIFHGNFEQAHGRFVVGV